MIGNIPEVYIHADTSTLIGWNEFIQYMLLNERAFNDIRETMRHLCPDISEQAFERICFYNYVKLYNMSLQMAVEKEALNPQVNVVFSKS